LPYIFAKYKGDGQRSRGLSLYLASMIVRALISIHMYTLEQMSFLKQYEQGMLSLEATRVLLNNIEMELKKSTIEEILTTESVEDYWNVTLLRKIFHPVIDFRFHFRERLECCRICLHCHKQKVRTWYLVCLITCWNTPRRSPPYCDG
jgi:hypothetical protein